MVVSSGWLDERDNWLRLYHRSPDLLSPQGRLRVYQPTSTAEGRQGLWRGVETPLLPGGVVEPGVVLYDVSARPLSSHPLTEVEVVALDVDLADFMRGSDLLGRGDVTTSTPSPVSVVDPFELSP